VVSEVRIYVEGGGDHADGKARLREGFSGFLRELVDLARRRRIRWSIIACGSRNDAFDAFQFALQTHPNAFNVLLVDSEAPVQTGGPWQHLLARDRWQCPDGVEHDQCHLMVQTMEAWLVADRAALARFYGHGFNPNLLPRNQQVEQIEKDTLANALARATRQTTAGAYHKIRHGARLLGKLDPAAVRAAAPSCERLFATLNRKLSEP
jgi:hypothetical protein